MFKEPRTFYNRAFLFGMRGKVMILLSQSCEVKFLSLLLLFTHSVFNSILKRRISLHGLLYIPARFSGVPFFLSFSVQPLPLSAMVKTAII